MIGFYPSGLSPVALRKGGSDPALVISKSGLPRRHIRFYAPSTFANTFRTAASARQVGPLINLAITM